MDKITHYRNLIRNLLSRYADVVSRQTRPGMETVLLFDEERDQYLWMQTGWRDQQRVHGITLHIRLRGDKIWIEQDWTEDGLATELMRAGVPPEDIVLAFQEPEVRALGEFAVA